MSAWFSAINNIIYSILMLCSVRSQAFCACRSTKDWRWPSGTVLQASGTIGFFCDWYKQKQKQQAEDNSLDTIGFPIVVMEMVDSVVAGVAFSANPLHSDRDELCWSSIRVGGWENQSSTGASLPIDTLSTRSRTGGSSRRSSGEKQGEPPWSIRGRRQQANPRRRSAVFGIVTQPQANQRTVRTSLPD